MAHRNQLATLTLWLTLWCILIVLANSEEQAQNKQQAKSTNYFKYLNPKYYSIRGPVTEPKTGFQNFMKGTTRLARGVLELVITGNFIMSAVGMVARAWRVHHMSPEDAAQNLTYLVMKAEQDALLNAKRGNATNTKIAEPESGFLRFLAEHYASIVVLMMIVLVCLLVALWHTFWRPKRVRPPNKKSNNKRKRKRKRRN